MIKAVVFDFDGVILESAEIKTRAFRKLFEKDFPDKADAIVAYHRENMGVSRYVKFRHIYESMLCLPISPELEGELGRRFSAIALDEILRAPLVPGAIEFLEANRGRRSLFIASGTPEEELKGIVKIRDLIPYFEGVFGAPATKPDIINRIMADRDFELNEVVFVGDAETDRRAADDCGVLFIGRVTPESQSLRSCRHHFDDLLYLDSLLSLL